MQVLSQGMLPKGLRYLLAGGRYGCQAYRVAGEFSEVCLNRRAA